MEIQSYFEHDSDDQIIQKRSENELALWMEHVDYIINESEKLSKIASNTLHNDELKQRFLSLRM